MDRHTKHADVKKRVVPGTTTSLLLTATDCDFWSMAVAAGAGREEEKKEKSKGENGYINSRGIGWRMEMYGSIQLGTFASRKEA